MPIKPENAHRYPANWKEIRAEVQRLARDRCENCGVKNHAWGYRDEAGNFVKIAKANYRARHGRSGKPPGELLGFKIIEIVCTTAHLDHVPENCDLSNLRFWCQRCHLAHDKELHAQNAYQTRRKGKAAGDLFEHPAVTA